MGTQRQAEALIKLMVKCGKPPRSIPDTTAKILAMSQEQVQAVFDEVNEQLGWNKKMSPATTAQLLYLADLEKKILGTALDFRTRGQLTYAEADAQIKLYKDELADRARLQGGTVSALDALI